MPRSAATNRLAQRNYNAALSFAGGSGSVVSVTNALDLRLATGFTVIARAFLTTRSGDAFKGIVSKGGTASGGERNYLLALNNGNTLLNCGYEIVGGTNQFATGTRVIPLNQWFMAGVTWDGSNVQCYQNGTVDGSPFAATGTPCMTAADFEIGRNQNTTQEWDGLISDVMLFSRALTAQEMSDLYFNGIVPTNGLVDRWKLDDGAGGTAFSQTGTHNGTVTAAIWSGNTPMKSRVPINGNKVKNGDFEYVPPFTAVQTNGNTWMDGSAAGSSTNDLFGWAVVRNATTVEARFDPVTVYSGSYSLRVSTLDVTGRILVRQIANTSALNIQRYGLRVSPNTSYLVTARIKTNNVAATTGGNWVRYDANGSAIGSDFSVWTGNSSTQDWTLKRTTVTTGSTDVFMYLQLTLCNTAGNVSDAWYDEISIKPIFPEDRAPVDGNLVKNFDVSVVPTLIAATTSAGVWITGTSAGSSTNSTYKFSTALAAVTASASAELDSTDGPPTGGGCLKLSTLDASGAITCSQVLNAGTVNLADPGLYRVLPSTSYSFVGYIRTNNVATNSAFFDLRQFSSAGGTVATVSSTKYSGTNEWTRVTLTFTTNASTSYIAILFRNNVAGNIGWAKFGGLYLAPTTNPGRVAIT